MTIAKASSTRSFEFYNYKERVEVLTALSRYRNELKEQGLDPAQVRLEVLERLIDDFQDFVLAD